MTPVVEFLGILIILVTFEMINQSYMKPMINAVSLQSTLLALLIGVIGVQRYSAEILILAILTFFVRGLLIPSIMWHDIRKNPIWNYREVGTRVPSLVLIGVILTIVGYITYRLLYPLFNIRGGALPVTLLLLSFLIIIARKNALAQLVGYISEENSLLYAGALSNLPMILEAGVLLDLLGIVLVSIILAAEKEYGHLKLEELVG